jgi:cell division protein FtsW
MLVFGLVMMWSASSVMAELGRSTHSYFYFLKRQSVWIALGCSVMLFFSRFNYNRLREWVWPAFFLTLILLVGVLFAPKVGGSHRWIPLGFFNPQPAEFAKLVMVVFLADYVDRKKSRVGTLLYGLVLPWTVVGTVLLLIALEPDIGSPSLIFSVALLVLFIGGSKLRHVGAVFTCALPVLYYEIRHSEYRMRRMLSFLDPFNKIKEGGYQLAQSLLAVGSGGWFGKGLGQSQLKLLYLPAPHTDFIFPVVCEELGFAGGFAVVWLFTWFLLRGARIARSAPNLFGTLLASGLTFLIVLQAYFNIAMSIGLIPTKGISLPFFSYGGSSMIVTLAAVGIILNVSKQGNMQEARS